MNFFELVQNRYSVRAYKPDPVPAEALQMILESARLAPTAANRQPFKVIVATTRDRKVELGSVYHRDWFVQAPIILLIVGLPSHGWVRADGFNAVWVDAAIVMDHMVLAAASQGLGTCWIANFSVAEARVVFGLPPETDPLLLTPLGYPDDSPGPKIRKPLKELVCYERWS